MSLQQILDNAERFPAFSSESMLSLEQFILATNEMNESTSLCFIRKDTAQSEEELGSHIRSIRHINYHDSQVYYLDQDDRIQSIEFDEEFKANHFIFDLQRRDIFEGDTQLKHVHLNVRDIEERHNSLWRHYFDQLFESYGSGKEPKIPITVKPSLTGKVMAAAATVVALSSLWLYRIQTDPDRTEGSHFRSIRNTYAEIKKENREKLGSQLTETKQAYYESKVDYDVIKQKTLALENTIYLSPPDDRGHAQAIGLATLEKFKKVTAGRASYNYPYKREEVLLAIHDIVLHKPNCLKPETDDAGNVFWYGEVPDPEIPRSYPGSGKGNSKLLVPDAIYQSIIQSKGDYDHLRQLFYQVKILEKKLEINEHFVPKPN